MNIEHHYIVVQVTRKHFIPRAEVTEFGGGTTDDFIRYGFTRKQAIARVLKLLYDWVYWTKEDPVRIISK